METTINPFKQWVIATFTHNELADITNHGAAAGWHGITYYSETAALYKRFEDPIWEMLEEDTFAFGHGSVLEFMATFHQAKDVGSDVQLRNLLVWYAVERVAFEVTQGEYIDE